MILRHLVVVLCVGLLPQVTIGQDLDEVARGTFVNRECYDRQGRPQRCMPEFENAAFGLPVEATNTCGVTRVTEYCLQTGATGARTSCDQCNAAISNKRHPPEFMTDFNQSNTTWWQSETMLQGVQHPTVVNLTLHLNKAYDITYVRLRFHSPRPDSFAIYKRMTEDGPWIPYQFYSASCERTYNKEHNEIITRENEERAICTDYYSDISPLTGGSVPFSTLEGRPGAFEFEKHPVLQEWVTATDIRIVLTRLNTFGDEVFGDPNVLKSYFYAISDLAVGARCKCNGHASDCIKQRNAEGEIELTCRCEHNTMGRDCEQCLPMYNNRPWARATESSANECLGCDCNGKADSCYYDHDLYERTGNGGYCIDCRDNTDGPHCERCKDNHYSRPEDNMCTACNCNPIGSENLQCDTVGRCICKPGVTGEKCDRCESNHYDFGTYGCRPCGCNVAGSLNNIARCNPLDGKCECKELVEGRTCDKCKLGYFSLEESNKFGCISCFCYGHSSDCVSASGYYARSLVSDFETGKQRWTGIDRANSMVELSYNSILQNIGLSSNDDQPIYFNAPARYLGDQRFSYNQYLEFDLRIGENTAQPLAVDVVIEGTGAQRIHTAIYAQSNPLPKVATQTFKFRLNEHPTYQWMPRLNAQDFFAILANVTAIKIRATYSDKGVGFLDNVKLDTASLGSTGGDPTPWVEQCTCPEGYVGQFCESCAAGYKRDPVNGGPFSKCVPCECNNHSQSCEPNTGRCRCDHNTEGVNCEKCVAGYYGNPLAGTPDDCQPCPCPDGSACLMLGRSEVICTDCSEGHGGNLCDVCLDGYYGDPAGKNGPAQPCTKCFCNENIDPNAVGFCNRTTGECRKCKYNTAGFFCEKCLPNYYGDPLAAEKGDCKACNCYPPGTLSTGFMSCDPVDGECPCLSHVQGRQCNQCEAGYWNLDSGTGCEECSCDPIGSLNYTCEVGDGQCQCKQGVTGRRCDQCVVNFYGFSKDGCKACNCDPEGSTGLQCDDNGNCPCQKNIEGMHCDRCMENKYNITAGCLDCPACYTLVQERVNAHRYDLSQLKDLIINIGNNPSAFNDSQFINHMNEVNDSVNMLLMDARGAISDNGTLGRQLSDLKNAVQGVVAKTSVIANNIKAADESSNRSTGEIQQAEEAINRAQRALQTAENYIDDQGRKALKRAQEALNRFGQQSTQMTDIANRAQTESLQQEKQANRIVDLANNALNTSIEARRLVQETLAMPDETRIQIQRLRQLYNDADILYNQTKVFAENAKMRAQEAFKEALDLYSEANNIKLSSIDVPALMGNTTQIKDMAAQIKTEAQRLIQENKDLLMHSDAQKTEATELLDGVIMKQQVIDDLLAEVYVAKDNAQNAVAKAEKTLQEANETLQTLRGFDSEVQKSKGEADKEVLKIPEIERMIEDAENKTKEARDALSGAESDADMALSLAKLAQDTAQNASREASRIREEANVTKVRATGLKDKADELAEDVATAAEDIDNLEKQADEDAGLIDDALQKAAQSKTKAKDVSEKVITALDTVQNISRLLDQLGEVNETRLNMLQRALDEAEQQLIDADLENQFSNLEKANEDIKQLVTKHESDYNQLKEDVDNIEQIYLSLPQGCFKNIPIEVPEGQ